jgi:periplasmic protein TonB
MLGSSLLAGGPGGQLQEPRLIASSAPIYPVFARTTNLEGVVVMDILVDPTGKVAQVKVVSGPVPLRQAAMDAIRQWKYQPAQLNGKPIQFHTNANVRFALR